MHIVGLIAKREFSTIIRDKVFIAVSILVALILTGFILICAHFTAAQIITVGLNGQSTGLADQLVSTAAGFGRTIDVKMITDTAQGEQEVAEGKLDALVVGPLSALQIRVESGVDPIILVALDELTEQEAIEGQFAANGLDSSQIPKIAASTTVQVSTLNPQGPAHEQLVAMAWVLCILLFLAIQGFSIAVARSVLADKSSRVIEILRPVVHPRQLLSGKMIGIGAAGAIALAAISIIGLAVAKPSGALTAPVNPLWTTSGILLCYLLGFFSYTALLVIVISVITHQMRLRLTICAIVLLTAAAAALVLKLFSENSHSTIGAVIANLPFIIPIALPVQNILSDISFWQIALSFVFAAIVTAALTWLCTQIYTNATLRTDPKTIYR